MKKNYKVSWRESRRWKKKRKQIY